MEVKRPRRTYPPPDIRLWEKADRSGGPDTCWLCTATTSRGYGQIQVAGRMVGAHRLAWILTHGPIPPGRNVLHNCPGGDNPACVNPAHLWLGGPSENSADMVAKGRQARGERGGTARLTEPQVREIRRLRSDGWTLQRLAARFGVGLPTVHHVCTGRTWAWLKESA